MFTGVYWPRNLARGFQSVGLSKHYKFLTQNYKFLLKTTIFYDKSGNIVSQNFKFRLKTTDTFVQNRNFLLVKIRHVPCLSEQFVHLWIKDMFLHFFNDINTSFSRNEGKKKRKLPCSSD